MGAVVLNVAKIVGSSIARSEIIDGQQRLTTLQLFLAALRDYAQANESSHANKLARLTIHEDEKPDSEGSFKVWPTNADRDVFKLVMMAASPRAITEKLGMDKISELPRMAAAYLYFYRNIQGFAEAGKLNPTKDQVDERLFGLLQALRTALQLVVIELEDQDDPQVIFETLNARGQPLLPSDLIRNLVFMRASNDLTLDANELYGTYWKPFDTDRVTVAINGESRFWHIEERQGRLTRPRIDLFMFHYLTMKTAGEKDDADTLNIGQLFREFRDWQDHKPQSVIDFLQDVHFYSGHFRRLIAPDGNDRMSILAARLKSLDTSTVYPFLLFLLGLGSAKEASEVRDAIIADLESWLIRRLICQLTNKNYNRFFLALLTKLKKAETLQKMPNIVRDELLRSKDVTTNWPDNEEFKRGWLTKPIYVKSRPDRSAMILRALEQKLRTSKNEAVVLPPKLTVEHLLPQSGKLADYPFPSPMPVEAGETDAKCRERLINTLGNLTLLTQELNSTVSNGPFGAKSADIRDDSDLRLNAWLRDGQTYSQWSELNIQRRGERLFEQAIAIWHFPMEAASTREGSTRDPKELDKAGT